MIEDELLKLRFKAGRVDALQRIYEKYRDRLLTLTMAMVNDAATAEDVVHDVFVSFAQSGSRFRLHGSLRAYLATCVVNRARDLMRARKRQSPSVDEEAPVEAQYDPPDGRLLSDEQSRLVARALAQLPDEQREVFVLHAQGGLAFRDIAALQQVPLRTAHSRYRYAIEKLRELLREGSDHEDA